MMRRSVFSPNAHIRGSLVIFPRFALEDWFARYKSSCHINMGSSDVEPIALADLRDAQQSHDAITLGYGGVLGSETLRASIASTHAGVDSEHVHSFTGATEAVFCLNAAMVGPGDDVVVVTPTYQLLVDLPRSFGASVTHVPLTHEVGGWSLSTDSVAAAMTPATRMVVVNSPNNPTGWVAEHTQLEELAALTSAVGAVLVGDEVYRGLGRRTSSVVDVDESAVSIGSVSKTLGVAGLRTGWIVARDSALRDRLRTARYWTTLSSSPVTDALALSALAAAPTLLGRARRIVEANNGLLESLADDRGDVRYSPPHGGTTGYLELLDNEAEVVARRLAVDHGVFTVPSTAMLAPGQHLRIALGRDGLADGLDALQETLDVT